MTSEDVKIKGIMLIIVKTGDQCSGKVKFGRKCTY